MFNKLKKANPQQGTITVNMGNQNYVTLPIDNSNIKIDVIDDGVEQTVTVFAHNTLTNELTEVKTKMTDVPVVFGSGFNILGDRIDIVSKNAQAQGGNRVDNIVNEIKSIIDGAGNSTTAIDLLRRGGVAVSYIDDLKGGAKIAKFCNSFGPIATYTGIAADTYLTGKDILQHPNDNNGWKVASYIGRNGIAVWGLYNPTVAGGSLIYYVTDIQIGYLDEKGYLQNYIDTQVQNQRNGFYYY